VADSAIVLNVVDYGLGTVLCAYVSDDDFGASLQPVAVLWLRQCRQSRR
jgi:hypothetical protein